MGFVRKYTGATDAKKAAKTSAQAADRATDMTWRINEQNRADLAPWRQTGIGALQAMAGMSGIPQYDAAGNQIASAEKPDYSAFYETPDYQFAYDQGMRATEGSLARRGLDNSGAGLKALTRFGQGLASQNFGNYINRLASLAGVGQSATNMGTQLNANAAQNAGATTMASGDARASGYLARGNAKNSMYGGLFDMGLGSAGGALMGAAPGGVGAGMGALMGLLSDRNEKKDIKKVGKTDGGMNVYTYKYKRDPSGVTHMGVMHQEAMKKQPRAGIVIDGVKGVDYSRIA